MPTATLSPSDAPQTRATDPHDLIEMSTAGFAHDPFEVPDGVDRLCAAAVASAFANEEPDD